MAKTKIQFTYDDVDYTLEYTAESLKAMERNGFNFSDIDKRILSAPEELFFGAFIANHKTTTRKTKEEIYNALKECAEAEGESSTTLNDALAEMLTEAIDELTNRKGNLSWRMTK